MAKNKKRVTITLSEGNQEKAKLIAKKELGHERLSTVIDYLIGGYDLYNPLKYTDDQLKEAESKGIEIGKRLGKIK